MEVLVTIAVIGAILAAALPSLGAIFEVKQRAAVRELGQTYTWLIDEAALRNVTFRVAYNLDRNTWKVEVGDADTLVFGTPEEREEWEEENGYTNNGLTKEEIDGGAIAVGSDLTSGGDDALSAFDGLDDTIFTTEQTLPDGIPAPVLLPS